MKNMKGTRMRAFLWGFQRESFPLVRGLGADSPQRPFGVSPLKNSYTFSTGKR